MLGHQVLQHLDAQHDVRVTLRQQPESYKELKLFSLQNSYPEVDVRNPHSLIDVINDFRPDAMINAVGIVKQRDDAKESIPSLEINALFPHKLSELAKTSGARLIHISTDCIFSGRKGNYSEHDPSDADDLYGKSKFLGEVLESHAITFRTSIIGLELRRKQGLVEWFLAQRGKIKGFRRAIFSGLTTLEMARVIERVLTKHPGMSELWHVATTPISKYDLLSMLATKLDRKDIEIEPDDSFVCDRSLNATRFCEAIGYTPPAWSVMLDELADQIQRREGKQ